MLHTGCLFLTLLGKDTLLSVKNKFHFQNGETFVINLI